MEHDRIRELTAPYALHALHPEEEREYEEHLRRCAACREELASLREAVASLAYGADPATPPPALRARILERVQRERASVVPLRPRWALPAAAAAAAAASIALGLGIWSASLSSQLEDERRARADLARATHVLAQADTERIPISGADGALFVAPTGDAALVVSGLEPAPAGKTYEAWVIEDERPRPAGLFDAGGERTVVGLERPVPDGAVVAVTVEPAGGVDEPTSAPLFTARTA